MSDLPTDKSLAISTTAEVLAIISAMVGLIGAAGASAASAGASGAVAIAGAFHTRRQAKKQERLERLVRSLSTRTNDIRPEASEEQINLFVEVVQKALEDDEEAKTPFYEGVLEWMLRERPSAAKVRLLSDAVQRLAFVELVYFLWDMNGRYARELLENHLPDTVVHTRLESLGLATGGVRMQGNATSIGQVLKKYCPTDGLPMPRR